MSNDTIRYVYAHFTQEILFMFLEKNPNRLKTLIKNKINKLKVESKRCTQNSHWGKKVASYFSEKCNIISYNLLINDKNNLIKKVYNNREKLLNNRNNKTINTRTI